MSLDVPQLNTASTYINNLLLARGLLRNGKAIDFAALGAPERRHAGKDQDSRKSARSAENAAEVINLVHDLILRRDRESGQLNALSETLTELHSSSKTQSSHIGRLKSQNQDLNRQVNNTQSSLKTAHTALHVAESTAKALREELAKVKATFTQVRTQCTNDVRKRDVQIQKLKGHLSSSQRGSNGRAVGPTCTISSGGKAGPVGRGSNGVGSSRGEEDAPPSLDDAAYSLKQETTEFLTQLSQNLSEENDSLIALVRSTLTTLRELQNLPPAGSQSCASPFGQDSENKDDCMIQVVPTSYDTLSTDLEYVLTNLRVILTNASFVPIDEVYARDEEINRLKEGWERMESRWREAVDMMKGWQERMLRGGGTVNLEELKLGLGLGDGLEHLNAMSGSPLSIRADSEIEDGEMAIPDLPENEPSFVAEEENALFQARGDADDQVFDEIDRGSSPLGPPPESAALQESTVNIKVFPSSGIAASRKANPQQENTEASYMVHNDADGAENMVSTPAHSKTLKTDSKNIDKTTNHQSRGRQTSANLSSSAGHAKMKPSKRIALGNGSSPSRSNVRRASLSTPKRDVKLHSASPVLKHDPPLTIEQKLEHAESEARRVSGTSFSDSPSPNVVEGKSDSHVDLRNNKVPAAELEGHHECNAGDDGLLQTNAQRTDPTLSTANTESAKTSTGTLRRRVAPRSGDAAVNSSGSNSLTGKTRATTSTAASRAGTLPRRGYTSTTRVPTKPPAAEAPPFKEREETRRKRGTTRDASVEAIMTKSRRKRKSTLSPEELEELMGLRRRADAEAGAETKTETNA